MSDIPVQQPDETDYQFDRRWSVFAGQHNEKLLAERKEHPRQYYNPDGEIQILDDEMNHSSIRKTARNRRWQNSAYENWE